LVFLFVERMKRVSHVSVTGIESRGNKSTG
jgi:hypothetical protein